MQKSVKENWTMHDVTDYILTLGAILGLIIVLLTLGLPLLILCIQWSVYAALLLFAIYEKRKTTKQIKLKDNK